MSGGYPISASREFLLRVSKFSHKLFRFLFFVSSYTLSLVCVGCFDLNDRPGNGSSNDLGLDLLILR